MRTMRRRLRLGELELSHHDVFERDVEYIYNEIFLGAAYDHPNIHLPEGSTIIDVGANVGLYSIWAARRYRPQTILAFEASPSTFECLVDNVARLIIGELTSASCFNLAVSREADQELILNQPPWNSGFSTLLDGSTLPWVDELRGTGELITHKVRSTTVSREMADRGLVKVDLLKIDVEGHFIEVLEGIAPGDASKVRNIVLEAEYADTLGHSRDSLCDLLRGRGYTVEAKDAAQIMIYAWRA
jgi:phthiocerol/phenolphthiocerol synthesis type-I polyketide synthase E